MIHDSSFMLQKLTLILISIFTSTSLFLSLLPTPSRAAIDITPEVIKTLLGNSTAKTNQDLAKEFCDKRNGELMNLETWFSGKCGTDIDSLSGEGVGFVDIIQLQLYEWWYGPQTKSFGEQLGEYVNGLETLKNSLSNPPSQGMMSIPNTTKPTGVIANLEQFAKFFLTNKPASSGEYIAYVSQNLKNNHIITNTYAASPGYGFTALTPLLGVWKAFRNIAYILFAIAFVTYGIMIMFRIRIDSKTAATIQLAIPKLITTLIIITFSYAIVGFFIDLSAVLSLLLIDVLRLGNIISTPGVIIKGVSGQSWLGGIGSYIVTWITSLLVVPAVVFNLLFGGVLGIALGIASMFGYFTALGSVISIIISIAIAISYFKLILRLFQSYITIIISLIFSPIILLANIIPGQGTFGSWIMNIIANLAAFPVSSFFLVLSYVFLIQPLLNLPLGIGSLISSITGVQPLTTFASSLWTPPMTTMVGDQYAGLTLGMIGFGLLLMSSKYVDMVMDALKVPPFKYGSAIGDALKGGLKGTTEIFKGTGGKRERATQNIKKVADSIPS